MNVYAMRILGLLFVTLIINPTYAQQVIPLWEGQEMPFSKSCDLEEYEKEAWGTRCVLDVTQPTLTLYPAKGEPTGQAVLVIPGGGYGLVAMYHEGYDIAKKFAAAGISAGVLKYRLPNPKCSDSPENVPLADARRALKILRNQAEDLGFEQNSVGVLGFSAGSHLATVASLWPTSDPADKPNFSVLIYGVTVPSKDNYKWLEESLYYRPMTIEEKQMNDLVALADETTPPTFLVHAYDDDICPVEESTLYAEKLYANKVPVEMHLFPKGGHGFGIGRKEDGTIQWMDLCINWLGLMK